ELSFYLDDKKIPLNEVGRLPYNRKNLTCEIGALSKNSGISTIKVFNIKKSKPTPPAFSNRKHVIPPLLGAAFYQNKKNRFQFICAASGIDGILEYSLYVDKVLNRKIKSSE